MSEIDAPSSGACGSSTCDGASMKTWCATEGRCLIASGGLPLDPIEPTPIGPGVTAVPLTPTPWDDLPDGQHAVTPDGTVWLRRAGLWRMDPWWQGEDAAQIIAICESPNEWAYGLAWTRKHVEDARGPLTPITLPPGADS